MKILKTAFIYLHLLAVLNLSNYQVKKECATQFNFKKILSSNLQNYIGKKVGLLLTRPDFSKYSSTVFIDEKPGLLSYLSLQYKGGIHVQIYVSKYLYTKRFDTLRRWRLSSFEKETISQINVLDNEKIIKSYR